MALYTVLPIYKSCYDFLIRVMHIVSHFPKEFKYSLGEKLQDAAIEMVVCIYKANSAKFKSQHIKAMLSNIQLIYLFIRIAHDMKLMPTEKYSAIILDVDNISKQAQGWLSANEKSREPDYATV